MATPLVLQNFMRDGEFLQSEANGYESRENIIVEGGTGGAGVVYPGTVMGKITASGKYVPCLVAAGDGSQTAAGILWGYTDATNGDVHASLVARYAEVAIDRVIFGTSYGSPPIYGGLAGATAVLASLAALGIIVRS